MMPRISFIVFSAAAVVLMSACGASSLGGQSPAASTGSAVTSTTTAPSSGSAPPSPSGSPSSSDSSTEPDSSPATETSGTEAAGPRQGSQPSVDTAQLPIGDGNVDENNCLHIAVLESGTQAPPGIRLVVTSVSFDPPLVEIGDSGCSGQGPSCLADFDPSPDTPNCVVPIKAAPGQSAGDTEAEVKVTADVHCPSGQRLTCGRFEGQLQADQKRQHENSAITVVVPDSSTSESATATATSTATATATATAEATATADSSAEASASGG
jgi:hypothetical protein